MEIENLRRDAELILYAINNEFCPACGHCGVGPISPFRNVDGDLHCKQCGFFVASEEKEMMQKLRADRFKNAARTIELWRIERKAAKFSTENLSHPLNERTVMVSAVFDAAGSLNDLAEPDDYIDYD